MGPCSQLLLPILSVQEIVGKTSRLEEGLQRAGLSRSGSGSVFGREDPSFGRSPACPIAGSRARPFRQKKPPLGKKDTEFPRTTPLPPSCPAPTTPAQREGTPHC